MSMFIECEVLKVYVLTWIQLSKVLPYLSKKACLISARSISDLETTILINVLSFVPKPAILSWSRSAKYPTLLFTHLTETKRTCWLGTHSKIQLFANDSQLFLFQSISCNWLVENFVRTRKVIDSFESICVEKNAIFKSAVRTIYLIMWWNSAT